MSARAWPEGDAPDLWTQPPQRYPDAAGYKDTSTSKDAAVDLETSGRAAKLEARALAWYKSGHHGTADECAAALGESVLSIRPRVSQLYKRGFLMRTGLRRANESGHAAHVLRVMP